MTTSSFFTFIFIFMSSVTLSTMVLVQVQSLTSPSQVSALKAFKASIKPSSVPAWSCIASWDFSTDPCTHPRRTHFTCGLTCTADSAGISQLVLDPAGYSGTLTPLISQLTHLTNLDLADNSFSGQIPPSISSLSNLQTLTLRSNSFSGRIPASVTQLKSLQSLDLSHNSLSGPIPATANSLLALSRLDLSYNRLTGSLPSLPPNLLELALKGNSLSGSITKSSFAGLARLEVAELGENSFAGTLESWFFLLPALQQVDLANNNLTRIEISRPNSGGSDLVALDLSFNQINGYVPADFAAYPLLSSLSLRHNRLRGAIPDELSRKKSLRRLFLDGNFLSGNPPAEFFSGKDPVTGSLGDNCLRKCPASSRLCTPSQKPNAICKQAYGGKPRS